MAKVFFFEPLKFGGSEYVWYACNGAKRKLLTVINEMNTPLPEGECNAIDGVKLLLYDRNNTAKVILKPGGHPDDKRVFGVFNDSEYGITVINGEPVFMAVSPGGPGNSESTLAIFTPGAIIKKHTYKYRSPASFWKLTEYGWTEVKDYEVEVQHVKEL